MVRSNLRVLAVLCVALGCAVPPVDEGTPEGTMRAADGAWSATISRGIELTALRYEEDEEGFRSTGGRTGFSSHLGVEGLQIRPTGRSPITLSTASWGGDVLAPFLPAAPSLGPCVDDTRVDLEGDCLRRVERRSEGLVEWWIHDERGVEQGWSVTILPTEGPLTLRVTVDGAEVEASDDGGAWLRSADLTLRYGAATAWDAVGRTLPAWVEVKEGELVVLVDVSGATAPVVVDPLISSQLWSASASVPSSSFGWSTAGAGDVNGDGFGDVVVGAPALGDGTAFLYLGSTAGLATTAAWTQTRTNTAASFGASVSTAGDMNGDGFSDVVVGAPAWDSGQGRVFLFLGSAAGLATGAATTWGATTAELLGVTVASAGDTNQDGFADLAIASPGWDNGAPGSDAGRVRLYLGGAALTSTAAWTTTGAAGDQLGWGVAGTGDMNGDGYGDLSVGAPFYDNGTVIDAGIVRVYRGSASGLSTSAWWSATTSTTLGLVGWSTARANDVNADGYTDLLVGAPGLSTGRCGQVMSFHGGAGLPSAAQVWTGTDPGSSFGWSVAGAGDLNGDGYADAAMGAPWEGVYVGPLGQPEGATSLIFGGPTGLAATPALVVVGGAGGALGGWSVGGIGDTNGDGYGEVILGSPGMVSSTGSGQATIYGGSGATLNPAPVSGFEPNTDNAYLGSALSGIGDVNGDGFADIAVGAWGFQTPFAGTLNEGKVYVFMGAQGGVATSTSWAFENNITGARVGTAVTGGTDLDGDSWADMVVGAPGTDNGNGRVYVFSGSGTGLGTTPSRTLYGTGGENLGSALSSTGDVNRDGHADLLVGGPLFDAPGLTNTGVIRLYLGSAAGLASTGAWVTTGTLAEETLGTSVALVSDADGDGDSEILAGAPGASNGHDEEGRALLWYGSPALPGSTPGWSFESDQDHAATGQSVANAGDVNGDGYSDVLIGAPGYSAVLSLAGRASLFLGSASGIATTTTLMVDGSRPDAFMGGSVAGAGDVNGDGLGDVIFGAWGHGNLIVTGRAELWLGSLTTPSSFDVRINGTQAGQRFGIAVSGAGDMNADGFADVIIGTDQWDNGHPDEGRVHLHLGNQRDVVGQSFPERFRVTLPSLGRRLPAMARSSANGVEARAQLRATSGLGRTRLQVELRPHGTAFTGTGLSASSYVTTTLPGVDHSVGLGSLAWDTPYHVRARVQASPSDGGPFLHGPWMPGSIPGEWRGPQLRTPCAAGTDNDNDHLCNLNDPDDDGDGSTDGLDCAPLDPTIYPGANDIASDGIDQNCNGFDLVYCYPDYDLDGYGSIDVVSILIADDNGLCGTLSMPGAPNYADCNDANATIYPGATERCDGEDEDCDGAIPGEEDGDGDGSLACEDCDDTDPQVNPSAAELCDGVDTDCDSVLPADELDSDGDGYSPCEGDCAPTNPAVNPGAVEACDGLDTNCDGLVPPTESDADSDGYRLCNNDCDDTNALVRPGGAARCDGWDNDCSGGLETSISEIDGDGDLYFVCTLAAAPRNPAYNGGGDCVDSSSSIHPNAPEACNGIDENCVNGTADEGSDNDGDGTTSCTDCDDTDNNVEPGAPEICDGKDSDCLAGIPNNEGDADADGWIACTLAPTAHPPTHVLGGGDCNDLVSTVHPTATELCNGVDDDCASGLPASEADFDNDGSRLCAGDCDDNNNTVLPGATELCDGLDNDCNTTVPSSEADGDGDGTRICAGDCNDASSVVEPGAPELCDGLDDDCDGTVPPLEIDDDGDGFDECAELDCDDTNATIFLGAPAICDGLDNNCDGLLSGNEDDNDGDGSNECGDGDCDDNDGSRHPGATEDCDGVDDDCDLLIDEDFDLDGDGSTTCSGDCDDGDPAIHSGAAELCDGTDQDCDGQIDEDFDQDGDGATTAACAGGLDCDDNNAAVSPLVSEICDAIDDDCDGSVDEGFDLDGDGYFSAQDPGCAAAWPMGDCDDSNALVRPGATELCNDLDDDCSGAPDAAELDADLDGFDTCSGLDCDDGDSDSFPGGTELCDGSDNDCDGLLDDGFDLDNDGAYDGEDPFCAASWAGQLDCDDADPAVSPFIVEACDGRDDDCDSVIDDGFDLDGDGATSCGGDCDDNDPSRRPDIAEICGNGTDDDCNGLVDDDTDLDGDGMTTCGGDCDDDDAGRYAGAPETCDGIDQDCDLLVDDGLDGDGDGATICAGDCDDTDPTVGPSATELCDGIDQDCDSLLDEDFDLDQDGTSSCGGDCDDTSPSIGPTEIELCDGLDQDCDELLDEDFDLDGDGAWDESAPGCANTWPSALDCDDNNPSVGPGAEEQCNGLDDDCEGSIPTVELDQDGDGVLSCAGDCDDLDPLSLPGGIEWCNGADDDCTGGIDEPWDSDGDGFVDDSVAQCEVLTPETLDCDDNEDEVNPAAIETCNNVDDDCSGAADEPFDQDGDGAVICGEDCDDGDPDAFPGNMETCPDGVDNNCDGQVDETDDTDGDGASPCAGDCDDGDAGRGPTVSEDCDGIDDDCDLVIDDGFDLDGDGTTTCAGDCDDGDAGIHPGAAETCDGEDEDCDGGIDEWFDLDGDGYWDYLGVGCFFGHPGEPLDCDDRLASANPGATELCDSGIDEDCDTDVDGDDPDCQGDDDSGDDDSGDDDSGDDDSGDDDTADDDTSPGDDDTSPGDDDGDDDTVAVQGYPGCLCSTEGPWGASALLSALAMLLGWPFRRRPHPSKGSPRRPSFEKGDPAGRLW